MHVYEENNKQHSHRLHYSTCEGINTIIINEKVVLWVVNGSSFKNQLMIIHDHRGKN